MKLTPLDIQHKEFRRAIRGYNEEDVDSFLDEVVKEFERLFNENVELKEKIEKANEKLQQYEGIEQTLQKALLTAQQAADDIQNNAKKEAELIIKDAEVKAKELVQQVASDKQQLEKEALALKEAERTFLSKFERLLNSFKEMLDKVQQGEKPSDVFKAIKLPTIETLKEEKEVVETKATSANNVDLEKTQAMTAAELGFTPQPAEASQQEAASESGNQLKEQKTGPEQTIKVTLGSPTTTKTVPDGQVEATQSQKKPKAVEIAEKMSSFFDDDLGMDESDASAKESKKVDDSNIQEIS